jgi:hypothetical protein
MLELEIPEQSPHRIVERVFECEGGLARAWPRGQSVQTLVDERILGAVFRDCGTYHRELIGNITTAAQALSPNLRGYGGKKVRDNVTWSLPAAQLVALRAMLLFSHAFRTREVHITDRWANVIERGDYSSPHSHYESEGSVVYYLDLGDEHPEYLLSGKFEIIDPRIPFCCSTREQCPTRGLIPETPPGTMILFPSKFLHLVHPYEGDRPRITLAFNMSRGLSPIDRAELVTMPSPGKYGLI